MRNNPYPDEPTSMQPTESLPKGERMEDLPLRPSTPQAQPNPVVDESVPDVDSIEVRQEEALTVRYAIGKLNDFLQWFITVLEVTLAIRFLLRLIGADPGNLFAGFLYALTSIILFPFLSIVKDPALGQTRAVFEISTLIAMLIYSLTFWAIRRFLRILITSPEEPST